MTRRRDISYGISIEPTWGLNYSLGLAKLAERFSFSTVWVPDGGPSPPFGDSIVTLSTIAAVTSKIRYGSAILNFYTRNPALIASSFLALSDLGSKEKSRSPQRAILGLGLGSDWNVSKFGISGRRGMTGVLREAVEIIKEFFEGKEVTAKTDAFSIERVTLSKTKKKIPIHLGTGSPRGLTLAGEIADGVILTNRIPSQTGREHETYCARAGNLI